MFKEFFYHIRIHFDFLKHFNNSISAYFSISDKRSSDYTREEKLFHSVSNMFQNDSLKYPIIFHARVNWKSGVCKKKIQN